MQGKHSEYPFFKLTDVLLPSNEPLLMFACQYKSSPFFRTGWPQLRETFFFPQQNFIERAEFNDNCVCDMDYNSFSQSNKQLFTLNSFHHNFFFTYWCFGDHKAGSQFTCIITLPRFSFPQLPSDSFHLFILCWPLYPYPTIPSGAFFLPKLPDALTR